MLQYTITPLPEQHIYRVVLSFVAESSESSFYAAAWTSGSYLIRDYSGRFRQPSLSEGQLIQTSKNEWTAKDLPVGRTVTLAWDVFSLSEGIHDAWLDRSRGFINPAALLIVPLDHENDPVEIRFETSEFTAFSSLPQSQDNRFLAADIQEFLDAPFTLIHQHNPAIVIDISSHGIPHRLLFTGISSLNTEKIRSDVQAILDTTVDLWGSTPFKNYLFHIHLGQNLFGGLEHEASCVLLKDVSSLPGEFETEMPEDYDDFLRLLAHEYFHAWLVKFLRPAVFLPYNLKTEQYTKDLWVFEGITSYYENLIPFRAGTITDEIFIKRMSDRFRYVREKEGFSQESLADASFNAWIHLYKQTADSPYSQASYYGKGAILAFITDMSIRSLTNGASSLDNVLGYWFKKALRSPQARGLSDLGFADILDEALGTDLAPKIRNLVLTRDLSLWTESWEAALTQAGLVESERKDPQNAPQRLAGLFVRNQNNRTVVSHTASNGAFYKAGIFAGDELIAVDGLRVSPQTLPRQIEAARGRSVRVAYFRANRLYIAEVNIPSDPLPVAGNLVAAEKTDLRHVFRSTSR